jgi:hypothetical protein
MRGACRALGSRCSLFSRIIGARPLWPLLHGFTSRRPGVLWKQSLPSP